MQINCILAVGIVLIISEPCSTTIDLSNVDLRAYRFFRYINRLPNGDFTYARAPPPSLDAHLQKAKAVAIYFRNVLLGNTGYEARSVPFVFQPTVENLRDKFQQKYGFRGEKLLEQLGNGEFLKSANSNYQNHWRPETFHPRFTHKRSA